MGLMVVEMSLDMSPNLVESLLDLSKVRNLLLWSDEIVLWERDQVAMVIIESLGGGWLRRL